MLTDLMNWLQINSDAISAGVAILGIVVLFVKSVWELIKWRASRNRKMNVARPKGGRGGDASVEGAGNAMGGRGGRAGDLGHGGRGGDASVVGTGTAIGGDGGDGASSWRPALGAASAAERLLQKGGLAHHLPRDQFGLIEAGRGGAGGFTNQTIKVDNRDYPFLPMLLLLRLWYPEVLIALDSMQPDDSQNGWDLAKTRFPEETTRIEIFVGECLNAGSPPFDPYGTKQQ